MRRLLEALRLQRRPRDVTPTLREYLAARARAYPLPRGVEQPT
jgi:hypothetical protein